MAFTSTCEPDSQDRSVATRTPLGLWFSTEANSVTSGSCTEETCTRNRSAVRGCLRPSSSIWPRWDRKSTRLNSSHGSISYAVFCLKKKKNMRHVHRPPKRQHVTHTYSLTYHTRRCVRYL